MKDSYSVEEIIKKFPEEAAEILRGLGYKIESPKKEEKLFYLIGASKKGFMIIGTFGEISWTNILAEATHFPGDFRGLDRAKQLTKKLPDPAGVYDQNLRSVYVNNMDRKNDDDSENKGGN